jgi:hypothetical protein
MNLLLDNLGQDILRDRIAEAERIRRYRQAKRLRKRRH